MTICGLAALAALLVAAYLSMLSRPTGLAEAVEQRRLAWEKLPPAFAPARPRAAIASDAPDAPPTASAVAETLTLDPLLGLSGPLGLWMERGGTLTFEASEERSATVAALESMMTDEMLLEQAEHLATQPILAPRPEEPGRLSADRLAQTRLQIDAVEAALLTAPLGSEEFDGFEPLQRNRHGDMVVASAWPLVRAAAAGDRETTGRYLLRSMDLHLEQHQLSFLDARPFFMWHTSALLLIVADLPGFPPDVLPELQSQFEAALLTPDQMTAASERWILRRTNELIRFAEDPSRRRGNTWHYFLGGRIESVTNAMLLPGVRHCLESTAAANLAGDRKGAEGARRRLGVLWSLANVAGKDSDSIQYLYDLENRPPPPLDPWWGPWHPRRLEPNWQLERAIVLTAALRFREDTGRLPSAGTELVPQYLSEEFLRNTRSAWRIVETPDGILLGRCETEPSGSQVTRLDAEIVASPWPRVEADVMMIIGAKGGS